MRINWPSAAPDGRLRGMKFSRTTVLTALIFSFAFGSHGGTNAAGFEFTGPEIFPIDQQISLLHAADLNGDHLTDLILANNLRSKINLLYNQTGQNQSPGRRGFSATAGRQPIAARLAFSH